MTHIPAVNHNTLTHSRLHPCLSKLCSVFLLCLTVSLSDMGSGRKRGEVTDEKEMEREESFVFHVKKKEEENICISGFLPFFFLMLSIHIYESSLHILLPSFPCVRERPQTDFNSLVKSSLNLCLKSPCSHTHSIRHLKSRLAGCLP